jgi:hydrogenase expression/formation protein HypC
VCLGFPGQVVELDDESATVQTEQRRRRASKLLIPDIAVGDWVYVAAGTIIERVEPEEARQIAQEIRKARGGEDVN